METIARFLLIIAVASFVTAIEYHRIPQRDGGFKLMTTEEVEEFRQNDPERFAYNASTDIEYHLYTRANPNESQIIEPHDTAALKNSNFDPSRPTRIITHGWNGHINAGEIQRPKAEFLLKGDYNVIGVDWGKGAQTINYITARYRVKETGEAIAQYMNFLLQDGGARLEDILPIGFSLGGHVVGMIGKALNGRLPAIVSLDPAGPLFELSNPDGRTDYNDAQYVEVIHSSGAAVGFTRAIGDADFYPNGGRSNPGCEWDPSGSCDHQFAVHFYTESINSKVGFYGRECTNDTISTTGCAEFKDGVKIMGGDPVTPTTERKVYWLKTNEEEPWARGME